MKYLPNVQEKVNEILSYSGDESVRAAYASGMLERLVKEKEYEELERYEERKKLYQLLDEILEKSKGVFKNRDELFQKFAEANFSGNYFKIARIIDNALGKGAFRKLADKFSVKS